MNRPSQRIATVGCALFLAISAITRANVARGVPSSLPFPLVAAQLKLPLPPVAAQQRKGETAAIRVKRPAFLSFSELVALSSQDPPPADLENHLSRILTQPFVSNEATLLGAKPVRPQSPGLGVVVRILEWNVNHGLNASEIERAFSDSKQFEEEARAHGYKDAKAAARVRDQLEAASTADIVILNEVDIGMKRTHYRDITRELAEALRMDYAFGVEFVELNRLYLGVKKMDSIAAGQGHNPSEAFGVDPKQYRGLDGNAVLSRYPIQSARIVRLPECYDWYHGEIQQISDLERAKRWSAERIFEERVHRQVRRGGRIALVVDLAVPESPTGIVTVVAPHLENYCRPTCRQQQVRFLLNQIAGVRNPVVFGGDLNTTGKDGTPTSFKHEILKRVLSYRFWAREAIVWFAPVPLFGMIQYPLNYVKNYHDPTALNIRLIAPNSSKPLFREAHAFRFQDGGSFDFQGRAGRSFDHRGRTLADSNQRRWKGFVTTFSFRRTFLLFGEFKLDWFFVKPPPGDPAAEGPVPFSPYRGRTMQELNTALGERISDHCPISVDLPLRQKD